MQIHLLCKITALPFSQLAVYVPHFFRYSCWTPQADTWELGTNKSFFLVWKAEWLWNKTSMAQGEQTKHRPIERQPLIIQMMWRCEIQLKLKSIIIPKLLVTQSNLHPSDPKLHPCIVFTAFPSSSPPLVLRVRHSTPQTLSKLVIFGSRSLDLKTKSIKIWMTKYWWHKLMSKHPGWRF